MDKTAREWIQSSLYYSLYDCCDSMHDSERLEAVFSGKTDEKFGVEEYVNKFLCDEYIEAIKAVVKENGEIIENWKEFLEGTPSSWPDWVMNYFDKQ